jgi:hypothetical protein
LDRRPVLYLDLDDTLLRWEGRHPGPAEGARDFFAWILETFEVRWLTRWCPDGILSERLAGDLAAMLDTEPSTLARIRGFDWSHSDCKLDGIAWVEHVVMGRPFLWIEDDFGVGRRELRFLEEHGLVDCYHHCNVSVDAGSLVRLHDTLRARYGVPAEQAA